MADLYRNDEDLHVTKRSDFFGAGHELMLILHM